MFIKDNKVTTFNAVVAISEAANKAMPYLAIATLRMQRSESMRFPHHLVDDTLLAEIMSGEKTKLIDRFDEFIKEVPIVLSYDIQSMKHTLTVSFLSKYDEAQYVLQVLEKNT